MTRMSDLPIARKQALAFAALITLFVGVGVVTYTKLGVVELSNASVVRTYQKMVQMRTVSATTAAQERSLAEYVATAAPDALERHRKDRLAFGEAVAGIRKYTYDPAQFKRADELDALAGAWQREIADREIAAIGRPDGQDQARRIAASDTGMVAVHDKVAELTAAASTLLAERQQTAEEAFATVRLLLMAGGLLVLAVSLVAGWLLKRGISTPIQTLTAVMHRLAAGDTNVEVPASARRDEVGRMAAAVQVFKDGALDRVRLEAEAAGMRRAAEAERAEHDRSRAAVAAAQGSVVSALAMGLERLAMGDLTIRLNQAFGAEYEALRANYNGAVDTLQEAMRAIAGSAQSVHAGSGEISHAADDLSRRTEQQAASLEETAAALHEITAAVRQTAEGARASRAMVSTTKGDAERSGQVVREAVTAMAEIEDSSRKIGQIIGVIDEIAFQTNLLALNAGVEAARAGDAGRGFAVVASEVRALAQRSADAAREIKVLIAASSRQVDAGVRLVDQTGQSLARIVEQVAKVNAVVSDIDNSAQQQAVGLQEVNTAVNQMDQVTQQNAAMVEQSTAASHALSQEAEQLTRLTARFDLGGTATATPAPSTGRHPRARATPAALPPQRTASALKVSGRGGAARRPEPAADAERWEEF